MSANLIAHKIDFSVFGRGYDDARGNSGNGSKKAVTNLGWLWTTCAVFDETGQYCWVRTDASGNQALRKYRTDTWDSVDAGNISTGYSYIIHPCNVANNLGYAWNDSSSVLFDLTTNEIIVSSENHIPYASGRFECVLVDGKIRVTTMGQSRATNHIYIIDTEDLSITDVTYTGGCCGYVNDSGIYCYYEPMWFSDHGWRSKKNAVSGADVWFVSSQGSGSGAFANSAWQGLTGHGNIYLPSYIGGKWVMGAYNASSTPDFETPTPSRTFGEFSTHPGFRGQYYSAYTDGKELAAWTTDIGLFVTDFENLDLIDSRSSIQVLAMTEDMLFCNNQSANSSAVVIEF